MPNSENLAFWPIHRQPDQSTSHQSTNKMCGRATLAKKPKELEKRYQAKFVQSELVLKNRLPNYNIAPTHQHPIITNKSTDILQFFQWGLIPKWAKDAKIGSKLINARSETVLEKPAFRSVHKQRCLVPFDGFYEWKREGENRIPYRIVLRETEIFSVAGIWEIWNNRDGETRSTFTVLTQPANKLMTAIHHRMPAILSPEREILWLSTDLPMIEIMQIIKPYPSELMRAYRVSGRVNKVKENDENLLEEVPDVQQGTLF